MRNNQREVSIYFLEADRNEIERIMERGNYIEYAPNYSEKLSEAKMYDGALSRFLKNDCAIGRVSIFEPSSDSNPSIPQINILTKKAKANRISRFRKLESSLSEVIADYKNFYGDLLVPYIAERTERTISNNPGLILIE